MRMKNLTRALALTFTFALAALIGVGCSCDEDEFNGKDACQKLVDAVNGVRAGCSNLPPVEDSEVCGYETDACNDAGGCSPKVDVEACVKRLQQFSCTDAEAGAYRVAECKDVFYNIQLSCSPKSGGNYGGDDDD
ncbi:hypothetical protein [Polyangium sp. 15x6]|uniref:hypothetical protein n=1 Tax=Polyangium sp. 15x6 TaxID=3042687 RepID=UPI00249C38DE|nr:hypothetical protein [Polyangium sp. 15x6]MDI3283721.1 hypothetical protein [Polyangium sp. 15x6]